MIFDCVDGVSREASLLYVSPIQINLQIPVDAVIGEGSTNSSQCANVTAGTSGQCVNGMAAGQVTVRIVRGDYAATALQSGALLRQTALSIAKTNTTNYGGGWASANVYRFRNGVQQSVTSVVQCQQQICDPVPIDLSIVGDQVYLVLYGTGVRNYAGH